MVGGRVIHTRHGEFGLVVHCVDGADECAIRVDPKGVHPQLGNTVWWQGAWALLTSPARGYRDKKLKRIGYSFDPNWTEPHD